MKKLAIAIEIVGIVICSAGIGMEVYSREPVYFAVISCGTVIFGAGGMLYMKATRKERKNGR